MYRSCFDGALHTHTHRERDSLEASNNEQNEDYKMFVAIIYTLLYTNEFSKNIYKLNNSQSLTVLLKGFQSRSQQQHKFKHNLIKSRFVFELRRRSSRIIIQQW